MLSSGRRPGSTQPGATPRDVGGFFFRPKAWEHSARGNAPGRRRSTIWFSTLKGSDKPPSTTCESVTKTNYPSLRGEPLQQRVVVLGQAPHVERERGLEGDLRFGQAQNRQPDAAGLRYEPPLCAVGSAHDLEHRGPVAVGGKHDPQPV